MGVGSSISKSKVLSESESGKSEIDADTHELEKEKSNHVVTEKVVVNKVKDTDKLRNKVNIPSTSSLNLFESSHTKMYCIVLFSLVSISVDLQKLICSWTFEFLVLIITKASFLIFAFFLCTLNFVFYMNQPKTTKIGIQRIKTNSQ